MKFFIVFVLLRSEDKRTEFWFRLKIPSPFFLLPQILSFSRPDVRHLLLAILVSKRLSTVVHGLCQIDKCQYLDHRSTQYFASSLCTSELLIDARVNYSPALLLRNPSSSFPLASGDHRRFPSDLPIQRPAPDPAYRISFPSAYRTGAKIADIRSLSSYDVRRISQIL